MKLDLLVYYAPDMLSEYTSENAIRTRVLYLITSANNALTRSKSEIQFNLLKLLPYDVDVTINLEIQFFLLFLEEKKLKKIKSCMELIILFLFQDGIQQKVKLEELPQLIYQY